MQVYEPAGDEAMLPDDEEHIDADTPGVAEEPQDYGAASDEEWQSDDTTTNWDEDDPQTSGRIRYVVDNVDVSVVAERVQYLGPDGKLITESLKDYTRQKVREQFTSLDDFLRRWNAAKRKQTIIDELAENGVFWHDLIEGVRKKLGAEPAPFDAHYTVFPTGPSAAADTEGVLVRGAQGVRSLTVIPASSSE
ncbi:MAG: type I restriction-modification enzyme R subunit C-terminal domain-containing protein [Salinisphaera sp.]